MSLLPWDGVVDLLKDGIDKIWPDKTEAAKAKAALEQAQLQGSLQEMQLAWDNAKAQIEVNKVEAASSNIFVAGWRPFVGWVCGSAFAWTFIAQPFLIFVVKVYGSSLDTSTLPQLDFSQISPILIGMLGFGAMRTVERVKGVLPASHQ